MCNVVVIIKQFREFKSIEEIRARCVAVETGDALAETSCEHLCALG